MTDPRQSCLRNHSDANGVNRSPEEGAAHLAASGLQEQPAKRTADIAADGAPPKPALEPDLKRLAALSPIEYERIRKREAKRSGIRVATLDKAVARERGEGEPESSSAVALPLPEP